MSVNTSSMRHMIHPFEPNITASCKVLILGSVPSIKTMEYGYPYAHPQNRFWKVMQAVCGCDFDGLSGKQRLDVLLLHSIALYDAIVECDIVGSSDNQVYNAVPANIAKLVQGTQISKVLCAGALSYQTTKDNNNLDIPIIKMPSTSPANAKMSLPQLIGAWSQELAFLK